MSRKFIFLINPISGTKDKSALHHLIETMTGAAGFPFTIRDTNAAGDYTYLRDIIINENITDVIICGGDGSINQVASALLGVTVNLGIIPMGSGNGLAFAAGIPKDPVKALRVIFNGNSSKVDSFYINDRFSCMLCGLGFDAQVAHDFAAQNKRGLSTYIRQTLKNFFIAPVYDFTIIHEDIKINTQAFFISIANSNQFGNNVRIAPGASLTDGLLDIVVVKKMSKLRLLYALLLQLQLGKVEPFTEKKFHKRDIYYFHASELIIENHSNAPLHIDGDPAITSEKFVIKVIRDAFRLLSPGKI